MLDREPELSTIEQLPLFQPLANNPIPEGLTPAHPPTSETANPSVSKRQNYTSTMWLEDSVLIENA
jgi:hypothetical protein